MLLESHLAPTCTMGVWVPCLAIDTRRSSKLDAAIAFAMSGSHIENAEGSRILHNHRQQQ